MSGKVMGGLDRDLAAKAAAKYDPERENDARHWIESITGEVFPFDGFQESLKDGVLLCKLVNALSPDSPVRINSSKMPFKQMENINSFLMTLGSKFEVPPHDTFQTIDLYEDKNPGQVVDTIFSLSRHAAKLGLLPADQVLGPKLADKHEVTFTDEQLRSGNNVIGLQMGFAGGASQSGQSWGGRRQVVEQGVGTGDASSVSQQLGFNGGANASGLTFGGRREIGGEYAKPDQE
ncbi:Muscle-specific protein 20 [Thoreauomyces humboldtii]|nr:Muscle-specific protein 20 [Thoreauomyces humboldtii]